MESVRCAAATAADMSQHALTQLHHVRAALPPRRSTHAAGDSSPAKSKSHSEARSRAQGGTASKAPPGRGADEDRARSDRRRRLMEEKNTQLRDVALRAVSASGVRVSRWAIGGSGARFLTRGGWGCWRLQSEEAEAARAEVKVLQLEVQAYMDEVRGLRRKLMQACEPDNARAEQARAAVVVGGSSSSSKAAYGDQKVANRDTKVWHGATENGP
jgi:hypothetical protein